jgi:hypothetical protein
MSDNITREPPDAHAAEPDDAGKEFIVRHIPLLPLFALLIVLGIFAIYFGVLTPE